MPGRRQARPARGGQVAADTSAGPETASTGLTEADALPPADDPDGAVEEPLQAVAEVPAAADPAEEQFEERLTSRLVLPHKSRAFARLIGQIDQGRYAQLVEKLAGHISRKVMKTVKDRGGLPDYNPNPYVLMATANVLRLSEPTKLADFMFGTKLYAGLETSFGRSLHTSRQRRK